MDNGDYRWFEFVDRPLPERFPFDWPWLAGAGAWAEGVGVLREPTPPRVYKWLDLIRQAPKKKQSATCPRIFVSHRQDDGKEALRLAWLIQDEGCGYWLDIVDLAPPNRQLDAFKTWLGRPPTELQISILTAAIIEMALLNCTHVIAAMTDHSKGSQWIPYEYGRVKEATPVAMNAASWWKSNALKLADLPEYLHLAPLLEQESDIRGWLKWARQHYPQCPGAPRSDWPQNLPTPAPLPTG